MSHSNRRIHDLQQVFVRQSVILRNNLAEWDHTLQRCGEDWPNMLGRLNAAVNQTINVDQGIEDALDHFAIEPKKCLANPSDVPVFLSVRIVDDCSDGQVQAEAAGGTGATGGVQGTAGANTSTISASTIDQGTKRPAEHVLYQYEKDAAMFAREFEESMNQNRF